MSTPLFIQDFLAGSGTAPILGASLATYSSGTTMADLTSAQDEPYLVEELAWCAQDFSTLAGELIVGLVDGSGNRRLIGAYPIPAGTSTLMASGRIELDVVIPVGWKLEAAHNVTIAGPTFKSLHVIPLGGLLA